MNIKSLKPAFIIAKREVRDQFRDWRIIIPILLLTLIFPFLMNFFASQLLSFVEEYGATIISDRLVPFFLMIVGFFPISVSLVIALETFVGEKERGSIEPLLNTPLMDWQLYLGKLISATLPPLIASYLGMSVYLLGLMLNHVTLPPLDIMLQIFTLTTVQAIMMVSGAVVVSSQATSVRAANLLASFIIIPSALLIQGESIVMFWGNNGTLWWAVFGLFILSILLIRVGLAHFIREELLGREIDVLNIKWGLKTFWVSFSGNRKNIIKWYRWEVFPTLKRLKLPILFISILAVISVFLGMDQIKSFHISLDQISVVNMEENIKVLLEEMPLYSLTPVLLIFWQNVRVILIAMILGSFSLGVFGPLPVFMTLGVVGYLMALLQANGIPVESYLLFIVPHGLVEIPAIVLASASILYCGALLATPDRERTVGEVWLVSQAKLFQIIFGIVIPLLLVAAFIEAWITPQIVIRLI
ncbi:MAG: stage II sporulation protein M [Anaerolineaceae bacterium]|nr:stage II sporulation protein M [Anaerolineaceae bacterium]